VDDRFDRLDVARVSRRVRVKRADFDRLVEEAYSGPAPPTTAGIWDGEVPDPENSA
jgi:hypothetical protein